MSQVVASTHPAPHRARAAVWQLLLALFLAPTAFAIQVMSAYVVSARMCAAGSAPLVPLLLVHAGAVLAAAIGFAFALVLWRRKRHEKTGGANQAIDRGEGRTRFLALCALYGSLLFLIAALVDASAVVVLGSCPGLLIPS